MPDIVIPEGFGRAAEKLVDTVRHVVDVVVGPGRIRSVAQAQADAALILARADTEKKDLEARTIQRIKTREMRRQNNIESITAKAVEALPPPEQISKDPVSEDWTSRFFEECQDIGDEQMQQIWARILAREVARPGSFAPRTLSVVRDLTKDDANLFAELCKCVWRGPDNLLGPIIHNHTAPHVERSLHFGILNHLVACGLIHFDGFSAYNSDLRYNEVTVTYFGSVHRLLWRSGGEHPLALGRVLFTAVGLELQRIAQVTGNDQYRDAALLHWKMAGWNEAHGPSSEG